jgi:hypothetical protein
VASRQFGGSWRCKLLRKRPRPGIGYANHVDAIHRSRVSANRRSYDLHGHARNEPRRQLSADDDARVVEERATIVVTELRRRRAEEWCNFIFAGREDIRAKLIKVGAKVVSHGRYVAFQMAEVAISRQLFAAIMQRIAALRSPPISVAT